MRKESQTNCPNCGQANAYEPQFVFRPVKCTNCGNSFAPGYARMPGNYAAPAPPASRANGMAIASLVSGISVWFFAAIAPAMPGNIAEMLLCMMPVVCAALAIVFGIMGIVRKSDGRRKGVSLSIAGIVLGL